MKFRKPKIRDIVFLIVIALLIIPQTRKPLQVGLNMVLAKISPKIEAPEGRNVISYSSWPLVDLNGNRFDFKNFKGDIVILNFWATWCPPCIAEMPGLQELYNDYGEHIEFVLVSNESNEVINEFFNTKGYTFRVYKSLSTYPRDFNVNSIPRTFLIDRTGNVIIDKVGAANWNSAKVRRQLDLLLSE